jgi:RNA polymerase sigma factor (sigma-70 family)
LAGDKSAGDELATAFQPLVRAIVHQVLGITRQEDWEDSVQTVFLKLFGNLAKWQGRCPFCKFVAVVAGRRCIDWVRCERRMAPLPSAELIDHRGAPLSNALVAQLERVLATCPANLQLTWQLYSKGMRTEEIAARMGRSARTVRNWLAEIREQLAQCLNDI